MKFNPVEFFKQVAINHKEILHTEKTPAFFREYSLSGVFFDNSDFLAKMRKSAKTNMTLLFNNDGSIINKTLDNRIRNYTGTVLLLQKVKVTDYDKIGEAREFTNNIWQDIDALLVSKIQNMEFNPAIFDYETKIKAVDSIADSYYGISVFFSYSERYCTTNNTDKWTSQF